METQSSPGLTSQMYKYKVTVYFYLPAAGDQSFANATSTRPVLTNNQDMFTLTPRPTWRQTYKDTRVSPAN